MNDQELRAIYDIVYAHECTFKAFATDIRALLADGGKGEAVAGYVIPQRLNSDDPVISLYRKPEGGARFPLYTAPQAECAHKFVPYYEGVQLCEKCKVTQAECAPQQTDAEALYEAWQNTIKHMDAQAECAPREAQPVGPRTTLNYDGTFDTTCAHCGGNGCFACLKSAAPTPERADADTAGALADRQRQYEHIGSGLTLDKCPCGYCIKTREIMSLAAGASERADAEKDAALTDKYLDKLFFWMCAHHRDGHLKGFKEFARAILTANGETPDERAEPRALTDARAKEIAQQVHAECSRIPGATFYNAAMSAIEQAVKERK